MYVQTGEVGSVSADRSWDEADFNKDAVDKIDWSPELGLSHPEHLAKPQAHSWLLRRFKDRLDGHGASEVSYKEHLGYGEAEPISVDPALTIPVCFENQCFHSIQIDLLSTPPDS